MLNKVIIMTRLCADPEIRYTQSDTSMCVARFSGAVDRMKEGTDFFRIVAFGKMGEFCEKYLRKGMKIVVDGTLRSERYTDKNGNKQTSITIIAEHIDFCEKKSENNTTNTVPDSDGFMNVPEGIEEDLPFAQPNR